MDNGAITKKDLADFEKRLMDTLAAMFGGLERRMEERFDANLVARALEERFDAKLAALEERFDAKLAALEERFDAELTALKDELVERIHDAQTELLRGFDRFLFGENVSMRKIEADQSNLDRSTSLRLNNLEERVMDIEKKLLGGGPR